MAVIMGGRPSISALAVKSVCGNASAKTTARVPEGLQRGSTGRPCMVWLTADMHYTAAHYYDPNSAVFQDFEPLWEFISGPRHTV